MNKENSEELSGMKVLVNDAKNVKVRVSVRQFPCGNHLVRVNIVRGTGRMVFFDAWFWNKKGYANFFEKYWKSESWSEMIFRGKSYRESFFKRQYSKVEGKGESLDEMVPIRKPSSDINFIFRQKSQKVRV